MQIAAYRSFLLAHQDAQGSWDAGDAQITAYVIFRTRGGRRHGHRHRDVGLAAAFDIANQLPNGGWPSTVTPAGNGDECAEVDAEIERAMQTLFSTPSGSSVTVAPAQLSTVTFGTVTAAGLTSVVAARPSPAARVPPGFAILNGLTYDATTTAAIGGRVTACFTVPWITDATTFADVRVLHLEHGVMVDRTLVIGRFAPDFAERRVCGRTGSLSSFAIALRRPDPKLPPRAKHDPRSRAK